MRPTAAELLGDDSEKNEESASDVSDLLVNRYQLAAVLGLSPSSVNRMAANGDLRRAAPGRYHLGDSVKTYIASKAGKAPQGDKARREKADADLAELKAAQMAGKLLDALDVEREWATTCRDLRAALLALPGRLSARLPHLGKVDLAAIDSELREALAALGGEDD